MHKMITGRCIVVVESAVHAVTSPTAPENQDRRGVLVVDDDVDVLDLLQEVLESVGYETWTATNGQDAIDLFRRNHPAGVLLDLGMPKMDGLATLHELRVIDPEARVAILTASCQQAAIQDAILEGADDYILKPVDVDRVREAVRDLVA